jgi:myosin heavy subunit
MKIYFSPINDTTIESTSELCVAGVNIETYLLEKGRVTAHIDGERNYHIFYYLLAAIGNIIYICN